MLKDRKLVRQVEDVWGKKENVLGIYNFISFCGDCATYIYENQTKNTIDEEEVFITEFHAEEFESDYHSYSQTYIFNGVYLAFNLNSVDTLKYFGVDMQDELINKKEFLAGVKEILKKYYLGNGYDDEISIEDNDILKVILINKENNERVQACAREILEYIRRYYDNLGIHITRMFGSYILLKKIDGKLQAIKATEIPIKYCPLMIKLLREVGGVSADILIRSLATNDKKLQSEVMRELINEVVIKGGYFDTNRPLNSCEANVLFGASETMSSAFKSDLIDAAVIVSNNLGTIITTNDMNTQGAVKRMTGLFHTSPNEEIVNTAVKANIIPVFPYTASIDQIAGVKKAIALGYKRIAVSVAAKDNYLHEKLSELEKEYNVVIYKFGLCSTGIDQDTAIKMRDNADVIWSCASKYVKEDIEPHALLQVGVKIPVHVMTAKGWEIVKNHLSYMGITDDDVLLACGDDKPVLVNSSEGIKVLKKKNIHNCTDCPHPCI